MTTLTDFRSAVRAGRFDRPTTGVLPGYTQANLVILPEEWALEFAAFAARNPRSCPVLDITAPGEVEPAGVAPGADLRTDVPRYRVFRDGQPVDEPTDLLGLWRDDLVAFLLGCSFTFETALTRAGVPLRHQQQGRNVSMYVTNRECRPAGRFHGPVVMSMRPIPPDQVATAVELSGRYPTAHGAPLHVGAPEALGIADLGHPDFGDPVRFEPHDVPVFWACGVTPQVAARNALPPLMVTHAPGYMFVTATPDEAPAGRMAAHQPAGV